MCDKRDMAYFEDLVRLAEIGERKRWVPVSERLPEIDYTKQGYERRVQTIAVGSYGFIGELHYSSNAYAKTEKGRLPRWEHPEGRIYTGIVTHWMPLPEPPKEGGGTGVRERGLEQMVGVQICLHIYGRGHGIGGSQHRTTVFANCKRPVLLSPLR